jgi:surfeit locus 1 family protein
MRLRRSNVIAAIVAIAAAALFVRLGIWQLHRLAQRRALNARVESALALPPTRSLDSLALYRRAVVGGRWDFTHEYALAARTHGGSPGVDVITPLDLGDGRVVLVNRGWVYSPDAATIDLARWHEPDPSSLITFADTIRATAPTARDDTSRTRRSLVIPPSLAGERVLGSYVLVAMPTSDSANTHPTRLEPPPLDEGPHRSYAIQWFSFAIIALVGVGIMIGQDVRRR